MESSLCLPGCAPERGASGPSPKLSSSSVPGSESKDERTKVSHQWAPPPGRPQVVSTHPPTPTSRREAPGSTGHMGWALQRCPLITRVLSGLMWRPMGHCRPAGHFLLREDRQGPLGWPLWPGGPSLFLRLTSSARCRWAAGSTVPGPPWPCNRMIWA